MNVMCKVWLGGSFRLKFLLGGVILSFLGIRKLVNKFLEFIELIFLCVNWLK